MKNFVVFCCMCLLLVVAIIIGAVREGTHASEKKKVDLVPHIGSIEVLNGCGAEGAADKVADFLRHHNYDVKNIGNAQTWNYPFTMVISRKADMSMANRIAEALRTNKVVLVRSSDGQYDVTVVLGSDYMERIQ